MSNIKTIELGPSTAIFVPADKLIEELKQLGLLPKDWKPKGRPNDEPSQARHRPREDS